MTSTISSGNPRVAQFHHATMENAPFIQGRREWLKFRDLGAEAATDGRLRANLVFGSDGMTQPTPWHYHTCESQFVYLLDGWVEVEFEGGRRPARLEPGHAMLIPGGTPHREVNTAVGFHMLEMSLPGDMGTVPCAATQQPCLIRPGSRVGFSAEKDAHWLKNDADHLMRRDLEMTQPSAGLIKAELIVAENGMARATGWHHHECEVSFLMVFDGWIDIELERGRIRLQAGDSVVIPGGMAHKELGSAKTFRMIEVTVDPTQT